MTGCGSARRPTSSCRITAKSTCCRKPAAASARLALLRAVSAPCEDKIGRRGIRVCDLLGDRAALADEVRENVSARNRMIIDSTLDWKPVFDQVVAFGERMRPWVADVSLSLHTMIADGKTVMFEGAQATLLDIDHGTYPFVTSSNASIGGVCTGLGVPPRAIGGVLGVAKAYTTRVGEGRCRRNCQAHLPIGCARAVRSTARQPAGRDAAAGTMPWSCATPHASTVSTRSL